MKLTTKFLTFSLLGFASISLASCDLFGNVSKDPLKTKEEIREALGDNYSLIAKYHVESTSETESSVAFVASKRNGEYSFTETKNGDEDSSFFMSKGEYVYTFDSSVNKYTEMVNMGLVGDLYKDSLSFILAFDMKLGNEIHYNTKESGVFLDRPVTIYTLEAGADILGLASVKYDSEYIIDDETGLTLKYSHIVSASAVDETGGEAMVGYEVTEFKMGGVEFGSEVAKIAVSDWPTTSDFAALNIPEVAKIDGEFQGAEASMDLEGLHGYYLKYKSSEAEYNSLVSALYEGGMNLNSSLVEASLADLSSESGVSFKDFEFKGYRANSDNYAYVSFNASSELHIYLMNGSASF